MCECLLKDKTKSWHCSNNGTRLTSLKNKFIKIFIIYYKFLVICKSPPIYVYIYGYLYVCQRDQQGQSKYMRPGSFAYFPMINWWAFWAFWWPWRTVGFYDLLQLWISPFSHQLWQLSFICCVLKEIKVAIIFSLKCWSVFSIMWRAEAGVTLCWFWSQSHHLPWAREVLFASFSSCVKWT